MPYGELIDQIRLIGNGYALVMGKPYGKAKQDKSQ